MSGEPHSRFNLSAWALNHRALTRYLMLVLMLLGVAAYFQLGQDEDPPFTFRAMVVRTYWPGATAQQVAEQVTDKLERTLQEAPYADKIRSYSKPGESQIIFQIKDSSKAADVADVWYQVRKKIGDMRYTLPQGVQGPFFNDDFGDVYGVIYALSSDGFSPAEMKIEADKVRQQLLARGPANRHGLQLRDGFKLTRHADLNHIRGSLQRTRAFHRVLLTQLRQHGIQVQAQLGQAFLGYFDEDFFVLHAKQLDLGHVFDTQQLLAHLVGLDLHFGRAEAV